MELVGLPGAGKSTLVSRLAAHADLEQLFAYPFDPGSRATLAGFLRLCWLGIPRAPVEMSRFLCGQDGRWLLAKLSFRRAAVLRRGAGHGQILIDAGVIQPFVSFLAEYRRTSGAQPPAHALLPALPLPSGLIYVRAPAEVALQRYLRRQSETRRRLDAKVERNGFEQAYAFCQWIVARYLEQGRPVVIVDAEQDVDDGAVASCVQNIRSVFVQAHGNQA